MRTIGVLGGMSNVASAEYYRLLNEGVNAHRGGHAAPEIVLYSVNFEVIEQFIRQEQWTPPRSTSPYARNAFSAPALSS